MHPKRRDNHDRYLMASQVKELVKKTAAQEGISEERARQQILEGSMKMFGMPVKHMDSTGTREIGNIIATGFMEGVNFVQGRNDCNGQS